MSKHVTLLGAGLTGPLLAMYLAKRGYTVDVYERRPDMRVNDIGGGRSINLALSLRGIRAIEQMGVADEVLRDAIKMPGRMIHMLDGQLDFQPYGKEGQAINSISRGGLNIELMSAAERFGGSTFHFDAKCEHVDLKNRTITLHNERTDERRTVEVELLIGTDGAGSALRQSMEEQKPEFDAKVEWLEHGYKELEIPAGENGAFLIDKNALHIWPRHDFMMIALPNPNGTFTCTLFAPMEGDNGFSSVKTDDDVMHYFQQFFPDAIPLMPTLLEDWHANPTSSLATVYSNPWHHEDWALLIGDAAHAIVPFYGQGMNACFEDCVVFDQVLEDLNDDWATALPEFSRRRKPDADAIARLALQNFVEMRSKVVDPKFLRKKTIDRHLNDMFPRQWVPLYTMVTFSTIPYSEALERSRQQDALLERLGYDTVEAAIESGPEKVRQLLGLEEPVAEK
jgi:kynurenine 3-monooxygenase